MVGTPQPLVRDIRPDLIEQLIDPSLAEALTAGSGRKLGWRCGSGHEWEASTQSRIRGDGCPYCSGRRPVVGKTDLATTHPHLVAELADPTLATRVTPGSNRQTAWICKAGHEWQAAINQRVKAKGCPLCGGRVVPGENDIVALFPDLAAEMVDPSAAVGRSTQSKKMLEWECSVGHRWRTQIAVRVRGGSCPYCSGARVIEGETDLAETHPKLAAELVDPKLATRLKAGSAVSVEWRCKEGHEWKAPPNRRQRGIGCPYCSGKYVMPDETDIATTRPDLAQQLVDQTLAKRITKQSNLRLEWQCHLGHRWKAVVSDRSIYNSGCPYCTNKKVLAGFNDLATTHPALCREMVDVSLSRSLTAGSGKRIAWKCSVGHQWVTRVSHRTKSSGSGCPECADFGHHAEEPSSFYVVMDDEIIKAGITNESNRKNRLAQHRKIGLTQILHIRHFKTGHEARALELAWIEFVKSAHGYQVSRDRLKDGWTEAVYIHDAAIEFLRNLTSPNPKSLNSN
jgi:hypothetical protein